MSLVVAAAILRDGCVLAARRTSPPEAAGRWELPGGKVEPGESRDAALVREVQEELAVGLRIVRWLDLVVPVGERLELAVALGTIDGDPEPSEHDAVRWVVPDRSDDLDWLEPDRPFLGIIARSMTSRPATPARGIFFDGDDARAVAERLRHDGWDADVVRERLAGEDDDEDHPWAVVTDAPEVALELLVEQHDGWLDRDDGQDAVPPSPPLVLPDAPKRVKRP